MALITGGSSGIGFSVVCVGKCVARLRPVLGVPSRAVLLEGDMRVIMGNAGSARHQQRVNNAWRACRTRRLRPAGTVLQIPAAAQCTSPCSSMHSQNSNLHHALPQAKKLAEKGVKVVITARSTGPGEEAAAKIVAAGGEASFIKCDVSSEYSQVGHKVLVHFSLWTPPTVPMDTFTTQHAQ